MGSARKYGDRLSSLLVVDNRPGTPSKAIAGSATASFTDANLVLEGKLPGRATGSWLVTGRRTYYDLIADNLTNDDFPGFQDVQAKGVWDPKPGHRLTLFALRSRESADMTGKDDRVDELNLTTTTRVTTRNDVAAVSYSAALGARASSRTVAAWSQYYDALDEHGSGLMKASGRMRGATTSLEMCVAYGWCRSPATSTCVTSRSARSSVSRPAPVICSRPDSTCTRSAPGGGGRLAPT